MNKKIQKLISIVLLLVLCFTQLVVSAAEPKEGSSEKENQSEVIKEKDSSPSQMIEGPDGFELIILSQDTDKVVIEGNVRNTSGEDNNVCLYFFENNKELTSDIGEWYSILDNPINDLTIKGNHEKAIAITGCEEEVSFEVKDNEFNFIAANNIDGSFKLTLENTQNRDITIVPVMGATDEEMPYEPLYISSLNKNFNDETYGIIYQDDTSELVDAGDGVPEHNLLKNEGISIYEVSRYEDEHRYTNLIDYNIKDIKYDNVIVSCRNRNDNSEAKLDFYFVEGNGKDYVTLEEIDSANDLKKEDVIVRNLISKSSVNQDEIVNKEDLKIIDNKLEQTFSVGTNNVLSYSFAVNTSKDIDIVPVYTCNGNVEVLETITINKNDNSDNTINDTSLYSYVDDYQYQYYGRNIKNYNPGGWIEIPKNDLSFGTEDSYWENGHWVTDFTLQSNSSDLFLSGDFRCMDEGDWLPGPNSFASFKKSMRITNLYADDITSDPNAPYGWARVEIKIEPADYPDYENYQRMIGKGWVPLPPYTFYFTKDWEDNNNASGIRPQTIKYDVYYSNNNGKSWDYLDWWGLWENTWVNSNRQQRTVQIPYRHHGKQLYNETLFKAVERDVPNGYYAIGADGQKGADEGGGDYHSAWFNITNYKQNKGKAKVKKVSSNPTCTSGNPNYSLKGAEYGIYKTETDAKRNRNAIGKFVTDDKGDTKEFELDAGTYYIKETKESKGYYLDKQTHKVEVSSGNTTMITSKEPPKDDPVRVFLQKLDAETGKAHPQGPGTLGGAEYTMKFYPIAPLSDKNADPAKQGYKPKYTWVFKTDKDGKCIFDESYKISGPKLPLSVGNYPSLPIGTVTIEETKAPEGYHVESTVHVRHITEKGIDDGVSAFNEAGGQIKSKERSFDLYVEKKVEGFNVPVKGVTFTHTRPNGQKETFVTDANGKLSIKGLENGIHYIEETALPDHFLNNKDLFLNNKKVQFSVVNGVITADNITNDGSMHFEVKNDNGYLYVLDKAKPFTLSVNKGNDLGHVLKDAEFTLYSDAKCTAVVDTQVSNEKGQLSFTNLQLNKVYYLKETKAPEGYRLLRNADGTPTIKTIEMRSAFKDSNDNGLWVDNEKIDNSSVNISNNNINGTIDIINTHMIKLPKTGNSTTILILIAGMLMMCASPFITSKKKR